MSTSDRWRRHNRSALGEPAELIRTRTSYIFPLGLFLALSARINSKNESQFLSFSRASSVSLSFTRPQRFERGGLAAGNAQTSRDVIIAVSLSLTCLLTEMILLRDKDESSFKARQQQHNMQAIWSNIIIIFSSSKLRKTDAPPPATQKEEQSELIKNACVVLINRNVLMLHLFFNNY